MSKIDINVERVFNNLLKNVKLRSLGDIFSVKDVIDYNTWNNLSNEERRFIGKKFKNEFKFRKIPVRIVNPQESGVTMYQKLEFLFEYKK